MKRFAVGSSFSVRGRAFYGLSGFDGKPFHPPLTDIPIGAYVIAPILDVVGYVGRDRPWGRDLFVAAGYTFLAGAIASVLAALTGLADWLRMRAGSEVRRIANAHGVIMIGLNVLVVADLLTRRSIDAERSTLTLLVIGFAILTTLVAGAAIGGSLVFDKGYKVRRKPVQASDADSTEEPG